MASYITAHLEIEPTDVIKNSHGLGLGRPIQQYVDQECLRRMGPYTPFLNGALEKAATMGTIIGMGEINQDTAYARFQYYGKVMTTEDGRVWAKLHESKPVVTERNLVYNKAGHQQAGSHWFQRMVEAEKEDILKGAEEVAKRT